MHNGTLHSEQEYLVLALLRRSEHIEHRLLELSSLRSIKCLPMRRDG